MPTYVTNGATTITRSSSSGSKYGRYDLPFAWAQPANTRITRYYWQFDTGHSGSIYTTWYDAHNPSNSGRISTANTITFDVTGSYSAASGTALIYFGVSAAGKVYISNIKFCIDYEYTTSACTPPTSVTLDTALSEGATVLRWSGAGAGTANAITGYLVQYRDSADGSSWGAWTNYTTVSTSAASGTLSVNPNPTRGGYRQFQVRTQGAAGSGYYSGFKACGTLLRKNTLPTTPGSVSAAPAVYESGNITIAWPACSDATGSVDHYIVQYRTSADAVTWSAWSNLNTACPGLSQTHAPSMARGSYIQYQVCAVDTFGVAGAYRQSANVRKNTLPTTPASVSATPAVYESGNITITWPACSDATGSVDHYIVQYRTSVDAATWSAWSSLNAACTGLSQTHAPSMARGSYIQYQVCAVDTFGVAGAYQQSAAVRKNTLPEAPASITVTPAVYESGDVSLSWPACGDATDQLAGYRVLMQTSADQAEWSEPALQATVSEPFAHFPVTLARGSYARFLVQAFDSLGAFSAQTVSAAIRRNTLPVKPVILWPGPTNAVCASGKPYLRVRLAPEPDGQPQRVQLRVLDDDGAQVMAYTTVGALPGEGGEAVVRCPQVLSDGDYTLVVRVMDDLDALSSSTASVSVSVAQAQWTRTIQAGAVIASQAVSHQADMLELLAAVNRARSYTGLPTVSFAEDIGYFARWYPQMQLLQAAMAEALAAAGQTVAWLHQSTNYPQAATLIQLREASELI